MLRMHMKRVSPIAPMSEWRRLFLIQYIIYPLCHLQHAYESKLIIYVEFNYFINIPKSYFYSHISQLNVAVLL